MAYDYVLVTVYNNFKGLSKKWGKVQFKAVGEGLADRDFVEVVRQILADLGIDFGPKVERPATELD